MVNVLVVWVDDDGRRVTLSGLKLERGRKKENQEKEHGFISGAI